MNFDQLEKAINANELQDPLKSIKEFTCNNVGHLESRLLHAKVLHEQISDLIQYDQSPLALQIELLIVAEQILDLDPNNKDITVSWLALQVAFNFEQTDLDRYHSYTDFLKQDKEYYQKGVLYEIDWLLFNDQKLESIDLYLHLIDFCQSKQNRLERDFYVSLYLYFAVYYLSDEQVSQNTRALELIEKYVTQLTYQDVYPIFYMLSLALDHNELELIDKLALQLIPVIQNSAQSDSYDKNLEEILCYLLDNHPNTESIIHAYLSLQSRIYGAKKWDLEVERLWQENPNSYYLKGAFANVLMDQGKYDKALVLLEQSLFKPVVNATFYAHYLVCHYHVHGSFPIIDLSKFADNPIKLIDNCYVLEQLTEQLDELSIKEVRDIQLGIHFVVEQHLDNYLNKNRYNTSAIMNNHGIAQVYHNMACFILDSQLEHLYPKAIEYSDLSRELSFFYYQLSFRCNLYKALKQDELFLQAIEEYLSYPILQADPSDYFRFKLQKATVLLRSGQKDQAIELYKQVKGELMNYFRENGTGEFNEYYLVHAFEADDTIMPHLSAEDQEPTYTPFEYFQFYPKNVDVLHRLAIAYYKDENMVNFENYSVHFFNAFSDFDYPWNDQFFEIMELYLPVAYKTDPEHVQDWLDMLHKYARDTPWLESYIQAYSNKKQSGGFFKNLFK